MSAPLALLVFPAALAVTLAAAAAFAGRLDRLGARLGLTEAMIGVLTALAADGPEISSAVAAVARGQHAVGLGIVLGSNVFNLAAMIGGGALVAGSVRPRRASLAVEAAVAIPVTLAVGALLLGLFGAWSCALVLAFVLGPYVALLVLGDRRVHLVPLPARAHAALRVALGDGLAHHAPPGTAREPLPRALLAMAAAVALIIGGAVLMVDSSIVLADRVGLSHAAVGLLVLAVATSLPNVSTALRLARAGRADAVVSETLNSNTINLVGGVALPALVVGLGPVGGDGRAALWWMCAITGATLVALARRAGVGRRAGAALMIGYALFAAAQLA